MLRTFGGLALILLTAAVMGYAFAPRSVAPPPLFGPTVVVLARPAPTPSVDDFLLLGADTFTRAAAGAWNVADRGGAYTLLGPDTDFAVAPGVGTIRNPAPGDVRAATLLDIQARDIDLRVRLETNRPAAGGNQYVFLILRRSDDQTYYLGRIRFDTNQSAWLQAGRTIGGVTELLGEESLVPGYQHAAGIRLWVRAEAVGAGPTTLRLKGWASADAEPEGWSYETEDAEPALQVPGAVTLQTYISDRITNAPVIFGFSDLRVSTSPVRATPTATPTLVLIPRPTLAPTPRPTATRPPPTPVASPTPSALAVWQNLAPQLDDVWGTDTAASLSLLEDFQARFPESDLPNEKLYAVLIANAEQLIADGQTDEADALLLRAEQLLPDRAEAEVAALPLTPVPTLPVSVSQPRVTAPARPPSVAPARAPVIVVRPAPPPPVPTKIPFVPPTGP